MTINPGFVMGPPLSKQSGTSVSYMANLLTGGKPRMPNNMHFPFVDLRDVAKAHLLGIKKPDAANKRFILCADTPTFWDLFQPVRTKYKQLGWNVTEEKATAAPMPIAFDNSASKGLGVVYTDLSKCVVEMADKMVDLGMVSKSKLVFGYWPIRAGPRGSINRHILHYAGVDFEETRHTADDWAAFKTSGVLEFPNLPYIIDGDVKLSESKAVYTYLCDKFAPELLGKNATERARVFMLQSVIADFFSGVAGLTFKEEDRNVAIEKAMTTIAPIAATLGSKDWFVGNGFTVIDMLMWECCETVNGLCQDPRLYTAHPNLKKNHDKVAAIPKFAAYIASDKFLRSPFTPPPPMTKYQILPLD